jgi:hypothetical protein
MSSAEAEGGIPPKPAYVYSEDRVPAPYREFVRQQARDLGKEKISNRSFDSAIFVTRELLGTAKKSVVILTGELPPVFYENVEDILFGKAVKDGVSERIVIWDTAPSDKLLENVVALRLKGATCAFETPIEIRYVGSRRGGASVPHFIVCDSVGYRIEIPHDYEVFNRNLPAEEMPAKGEVCFNDKDTSSFLVSYFDRLWDALGNGEGTSSR